MNNNGLHDKYALEMCYSFYASALMLCIYELLHFIFRYHGQLGL